MSIIKKRQLVRQIDGGLIKQAICQAEANSTGEICVSIAPIFWGSVRRNAERAFVRLGMTQTRYRNAVLIYVVPARHKFVILGDVGIHSKVEQQFWEKVSETISRQFHENRFTEGLIEGIAQIGEQLAVHFPSSSENNLNELPDEPDIGK